MQNFFNKIRQNNPLLQNWTLVITLFSHGMPKCICSWYTSKILIQCTSLIYSAEVTVNKHFLLVEKQEKPRKHGSGETL